MDDKLSRIWAEIIEEEKKRVTKRLDGEITIYEFMKETGLTRDQAVKHLKKRVERGELSTRTKVYLPDLGGVFTLYCPVIKTE